MDFSKDGGGAAPKRALLLPSLQEARMSLWASGYRPMFHVKHARFRGADQTLVRRLYRGNEGLTTGTDDRSQGPIPAATIQLSRKIIDEDDRFLPTKSLDRLTYSQLKTHHQAL
jgi:hypothetical protein